MDNISGLLLVPPDRNNILGRPASWKVRWVTLGKRVPIAMKKEKDKDKDKEKDKDKDKEKDKDKDKDKEKDKDRQKDPSSLPGRVNSHPDFKPLSKIYTDEYCISVFKHKSDPEPVHEWPMSLIADCSIDVVSLRKQESAQPTLILTLSDKERKRRSTRSAGLISGKDSPASNVWFRSSHDDTQPNLQQWAQAILAKKQPASSDGQNPALYSSPFTPRNREAIDFSAAGGGSTQVRNDLRSLGHKTASVSYSAKDIPTFSSDSPSIRSRNSNVSSPSSLNQQQQTGQGGNTYTVGGQHYTTVLSSDVGPSANAAGNDHGGTHDGRAVAQGTEGQDGIVYDEVSAPPAPGETILDRAFQLGHIPGAEHYIPGQENISSIARFDALMRELDEKRTSKQSISAAAAPTGSNETQDQKTPTATLAADDNSDAGAESRFFEEHSDSDSDDDRAYADDQEDEFYNRGPLISPSARKALDFIAGRSEAQQQQQQQQQQARETRPSRPAMPRTHQSYLQSTSTSSSTDAQTLRPQSPTKQARPHTSHGRSRFNQSNRANSNASSHPPVSASALLASVSASAAAAAAAAAASAAAAAAPSLSSSGAASATASSSSAGANSSAIPTAVVVGRKAGDSFRRASGEKRQSGSSLGSNSKRLSFSEFTRRLSSTSSLLLYQANAGGGGSRGHAENETPAPAPPTTSSSPAVTAAAAIAPISTNSSAPTTIAASFAATGRPPSLTFFSGVGLGVNIGLGVGHVGVGHVGLGVGHVGLGVGLGGGPPQSPLLPMPLSSDPYSRKRQYREERVSRKCAWRGSVGVIDEGRFM